MFRHLSSGHILILCFHIAFKLVRLHIMQDPFCYVLFLQFIFIQHIPDIDIADMVPYLFHIISCSLDCLELPPAAGHKDHMVLCLIRVHPPDNMGDHIRNLSVVTLKHKPDPCICRKEQGFFQIFDAFLHSTFSFPSNLLMHLQQLGFRIVIKNDQFSDKVLFFLCV